MAIRIIVVGTGPRGQNWLREVQRAPGYRLVACVDIDQAVLEQAASKLSLPERQCFTELCGVLDPDSCDALIVATSAASHFETC